VAPVGEIALIDINSQTLHLVRSNCYVQLRLVPNQLVKPDPAVMQPLEPLAHELEDYLAGNTVEPGQQRLPNLQLGISGSPNLTVGDVFKLTIAGDDFATFDGGSNNTSAVICAGPKLGNERHMEYFVVGMGQAQLSVHAAHEETLLPVTKTCKVGIVLNSLL
jgi:hypothetical protein